MSRVPMPKPDPALAFKVNDARRKLVMESASTRTKLVGSLLLSDFFCTDCLIAARLDQFGMFDKDLDLVVVRSEVRTECL